MKLEKMTDDEIYDEVPETMWQLMNYLNIALKYDPFGVTKLLDYDTEFVNLDKLKKEYTNIIARDNYILSVLGLLSGFVNTEKYRIYAEFENNERPYGKIIKFGAIRVTDCK